MNNLRKLFPEVEPYETGMLEVSDLHSIYWEQTGNPSGIPVVVLHGGPGGSSDPIMRRFFDPSIFRIILFDQRGCGQSIPHGELKDNNTENLISDMEALRKRLNIDTWHVSGGSWGSTLALAYAEEHPDSCDSLLLRGIFTMRQTEVNWFLGGMKNVFPEVWDKFEKHLPKEERSNILENYYKRLINPDPDIHIPAALHWATYEGSFSHLKAKNPSIEDADIKESLAIARIEAHYFRNNMFQPDDKLLRNINKIKHIPCSIVQGRYDMVCPTTTAWELHQNYPNSKYYVIDDAGHSSTEIGIIDKLITSIEEHVNHSPNSLSKAREKTPTNK